MRACRGVEKSGLCEACRWVDEIDRVGDDVLRVLVCKVDSRL